MLTFLSLKVSLYKNVKFSITNFSKSKTEFRASQSQSEKTLFFKTLFGFSNLDIYRNVQNPFSFLLLAITFLHFSKIERKY